MEVLNAIWGYGIPERKNNKCKNPEEGIYMMIQGTARRLWLEHSEWMSDRQRRGREAIWEGSCKVL